MKLSRSGSITDARWVMMLSLARGALDTVPRSGLCGRDSRGRVMMLLRSEDLLLRLLCMRSGTPFDEAHDKRAVSREPAAAAAAPGFGTLSYEL